MMNIFGKGKWKWLFLAGALLYASRANAEDSLRVYNQGNTTSVKAGSMYLNHYIDAQEGQDLYDVPLTNSPPLSGTTQWLNIVTSPYGVDLQQDSRSVTSETLFQGRLSPINSNGGNVSSTNRIKFVFISGPEMNRIYLAKIHCNGAYTRSGQDFDTVINIRDAIARPSPNKGYVDLPGIVNCPSGTVYGTVDVSCRFLRDPNITNMTYARAGGTNYVGLETIIQPGSYVTDVVERTSNLMNPNWTGVYTNAVGYKQPTLENFDKILPHTNNVASTNPVSFFRIRRIETTQ
jgi:hypothetical protein